MAFTTCLKQLMWICQSCVFFSASHAVHECPVRTPTTVRLFHKEQTTLGYAAGCQNISRLPDGSATIKIPCFSRFWAPPSQHHPNPTGKHTHRHVWQGTCLAPHSPLWAWKVAGSLCFPVFPSQFSWRKHVPWCLFHLQGHSRGVLQDV